VLEEDPESLVVEEEQASPIWEEKQSLPLPDNEAGSSPSYYGWSSSDEDYETNLKGNKDATNLTKEDESPKSPSAL
jgi:hypothetical protein